MIHLAIAFDKNYLTPFYALASSIFFNNPNQGFTFHCITRNVNEQARDEIRTYLATSQSVVYFYEVSEELIKNFVVGSHWNVSVYLKLFFPLLVPRELTRLLYLDTDIVVNASLKRLYEEDLEKYPLGAVYDCYVKKQEDIGITQEGNYFNSGVMLFNLPLWKEQKISEKAIDFLHQYPEKIKFVDQDALNAVLIDNWKKLPEKYNLIYSYIPQDASKKELTDFLHDQVIVHFTLQRPWSFLCKNRYRYLYKFYLKKSPKKEEKAIKDFTFAKIIPFLRLRLVEFYLDNKWLQKIWRKIKNRI